MMSGQTRRDLKRKGRASARTHYGVFAFICLIAAFIDAEYGNSLGFLSYGREHLAAISDFFNHFGRPGFAASSRGVLALAVRGLSKGSPSALIENAILSLAGANRWLEIAGIVGNALVALLFWAFAANVFRVMMRRVVLEGRIYRSVPLHRLQFIAQVRSWRRTALAMLRLELQRFLWMLTIVGGPIKAYSYALVPFILAENPSLSGKQAILLSRTMMNGHKWELFVMDLSFLPWHLLSLVTLGLSDAVFGSCYRLSARAEFYAQRRQEAREAKLPGADALFDEYLYRRADEGELAKLYPPLTGEVAIPQRHYRNGVERFFCETFGLTLWPSEEDMEIERAEMRIRARRYVASCASGDAYPMRLYPLPRRRERSEHEPRLYSRRYCVFSVILIFFAFSIVGWLWEVGLHLVTQGVFVNRGTLHGPWLPIYGAGGAMALLLLYRLRKRPGWEFTLTVVLCGFVEYMTAYYLETTHGGQRWWDYGGYFLNLDGRICAEGLLVFGMGGMAAVYAVAPALDNLFRKMKRPLMVALCVVLLACYSADVVYSHAHPNTGAGITDYETSNIDEFSADAPDAGDAAGQPADGLSADGQPADGQPAGGADAGEDVA